MKIPRSQWVTMPIGERRFLMNRFVEQKNIENEEMERQRTNKS